MIRKLTLALCFLVLMSSAVAAKTLVVAGHCGYPPMEYLNDKKVPTGYSIDYIKEVAKRAGFDMKFRDVAWDGIFAGLASGNYDILASSTTITPERRRPSTSPTRITASCRPWSWPRARRSTAWPASRA